MKQLQMSFAVCAAVNLFQMIGEKKMKKIFESLKLTLWLITTAIALILTFEIVWLVMNW